MLAVGDKVGLVCCSNGLPHKDHQILWDLKNVLERSGLVPVFSDHIYAVDSVFSGAAQERAQVLMEFYENPEIKAVFDISGGDIANEILPYLDFRVIAGNPKLFWGYSDLTTIINAIYAKTGLPSVLYQVRNLVYGCARLQQRNFFDTVFGQEDSLFDFPYSFVQGAHMEGVILGGNIRCFLKLAGTEFFPDLQDKLLFLEARSGNVPQIVTYLSQLKMLGAFDKIKGALLGSFTQMEREGAVSDLISLVKSYAVGLPVAKTERVGHGTDSMGLLIGGYRDL